jgi:hypothetical protein
MRTEHVELRDSDIPTTDGIEIEELDVDEVEIHPPVDPRLEGLSTATRGVINDAFNGDVDEAVRYASKRCNQFARPADWAQELVGFTKGWKDDSRVRC